MRRPAKALVEFALAISVFMLLVLGTFDLARAYMAYTVVANAAREASRYGAVHAGETDWKAAAVPAGTNLAGGLDPNALEVTPTAQTIDMRPSITVSGDYQVDSIRPLGGTLLGD